MTEQLWIAVLSSSALTGVLVAVISGLFGLRARRSEYVNEYHRRILDKRIEAYASVEQLVFGLKNVSLGCDGLSDSVSDHLQKFMDLFYGFDADKEPLESFGQRHYDDLGSLRVELERALADDLLKLDDVGGFLKAKRKVAHGHRALAVGPDGIRELGRL
ncbi:MAG: hypothetical protein WD646_08920 [Actinomycetota bacterium]